MNSTALNLEIEKAKNRLADLEAKAQKYAGELRTLPAKVGLADVSALIAELQRLEGVPVTPAVAPAPVVVAVKTAAPKAPAKPALKAVTNPAPKAVPAPKPATKPAAKKVTSVGLNSADRERLLALIAKKRPADKIAAALGWSVHKALWHMRVLAKK